MKYIKTFENLPNYLNKPEYEIGDYVRSHYYERFDGILTNIWKVLDKKPIESTGGISSKMDYFLEDLYGNTSWLNEQDISKKITKKQAIDAVEKAELKKSMKKYNL